MVKCTFGQEKGRQLSSIELSPATNGNGKWLAAADLGVEARVCADDKQTFSNQQTFLQKANTKHSDHRGTWRALHMPCSRMKNVRGVGASLGLHVRAEDSWENNV